MTKLEALAKDCIENHTHRLVDKPTKQDIYLREESIFIQGYRQSEKRIAELEQKLEQTEKDLADYQFNYLSIKELSKENAELKSQIEKMKNCYNCNGKLCKKCCRKNKKSKKKDCWSLSQYLEN